MNIVDIRTDKIITEADMVEIRTGSHSLFDAYSLVLNTGYRISLSLHEALTITKFVTAWEKEREK